MAERLIKATASGWRPLAIGAALSMAGAALVLFLKQRAASRTDPDDIEAWWRHREKVRSNGDHPPTTGRGNEGNFQLFV